MSAVPVESTKSVPASPVLATCLLAGRIASRRRIQTQAGPVYLTVVKLPAVDEYTAPQTVELRSAEPLGEVGSTWRGKVQIGGYPRSYQVDDELTGRKVTVQTATVTLTVL